MAPFIMSEKKSYESELKFIGLTEDLIADAVMFAQALSVKTYLRNQLRSENGQKPKVPSHEILKLATNSKCEVASANAAYYLLAREKGKMFEKMFILVGAKNNTEGADEFDGEQGEKGWGIHAYLCIKIVGGDWIAISPANYDKEKYDQRSNRVNQASSLELLIDLIERRDGGRFPRPTDLRSNYKSPKRSIRLFHDEVGSGFERNISIWTVTNSVYEENSEMLKSYTAYISEKDQVGNFSHRE